MTFSAKAAVITFTGGTATDAYNNTHVTTEHGTYFNIVSYVENGFEMRYVSSSNNYNAQTVVSITGQKMTLYTVTGLEV